MFIEELELDDYDRLNINNFTKVVLNFKKKVQVIIGTNGSGKSSIVAELSPLPAEAKNFSKTGRKRIVIKHNKKRYILTSSFHPTANHSFMIEGQDDDLNPGGTITVQRELVKKHFGIDSLTHSLASGKHQFHLMGANQRRDWFRLLCDTNYDYAIGVFKRLKDKHRDIVGGINIAKNKLVSQTSKIMPKSDLEALEKECEDLYKIVECMIEQRKPVSIPLEKTEDKINRTLAELQDGAHDIFKICARIEKNYLTGVVENLNDSQSMEFFIKNRLVEIKNRKTDLYDQFREVSSKIELLEKTKLFNVSIISTKLETLRTNRNALEKQKSYTFESPYPEDFLSLLNTFSADLLKISLNIDTNTDGKFSRDKFKDLVLQKEDCARVVNIQKANIENYKESIAHLEEHKATPDVACPKCHHTWKPLYNLGKIDELKTKIYTASLEVDHKLKLIEDYDVQINIYNEWVKNVELVKEFSQTYSTLNSFWNLILKKEVLFENPRSISMIVTNYGKDLLIDRDVSIIDKDIQEELDKLQLTENVKGDDLVEMEAKFKAIQYEMNNLSNEELRFNATKDIVAQLARDVKTVQEMSAEANVMQSTLDDTYRVFSEDLRSTLFNEVLRSFQSDLALKESAISEVKAQANNLVALQEEIEQFTKSEVVLKAILKELSPTEGIIAEGLFGYMKLFVRKMNKFIAPVWSYPLVVKPCKSEEGKIELNYKFPLMVKTANNVRNDVVEGSSSMREIVDVAFTISSLKAIGLSKSTLFFDEFGSTMDAYHKKQSSRMLDDIIESEQFEQIFVISHDIAQYSSLDNTEVFVLHADNVIIPTGCVYNQHVKFD